MKRVLGILLALFLVAGLATSASAMLIYDDLSIDVDFWTNASDRLGPGDQGGTFNLSPGDEINIDFYITTELDLSALTFDIQYDPTYAQALRREPTPLTADMKSFAPVSFDISTPGSAKFGTGVFDLSSGDLSTVTGEDILFATIVFECTGIGDVDLMLANYGGFSVGLPPSYTINIDTAGLIGTLHQTPIPGALWLLGTGLAGLVGVRRIKRR